MEKPNAESPSRHLFFALFAFSAVSPLQSFTFARMSFTASRWTMNPRTFSFT